MGERFVRVRADGWAQAKPIIDAAMEGRAKRFVDLPWTLDTDRGARDTWWTFSYSRVLDAAGRVAGLFIFTNETTDRVLGDAALRESEERQAFLRDRQGAVIGAKLAAKFGWKVGDTIPLRGTIYPGTWNFTVRGIYRGADAKTDEQHMFIHWKLLAESIRKRAGGAAQADHVGVYIVGIDEPSDAPLVGTAAAGAAHSAATITTPRTARRTRARVKKEALRRRELPMRRTSRIPGRRSPRTPAPSPRPRLRLTVRATLDLRAMPDVVASLITCGCGFLICVRFGAAALGLGLGQPCGVGGQIGDHAARHPGQSPLVRVRELARQLVQRHPCDLADLVIGVGKLSTDAAQQIVMHRFVDAFALADKPVVDLAEGCDHRALNTGLLRDLADRGLFRGLAGLDVPLRERPHQPAAPVDSADERR